MRCLIECMLHALHEVQHFYVIGESSRWQGAGIWRVGASRRCQRCASGSEPHAGPIGGSPKFPAHFLEVATQVPNFSHAPPVDRDALNNTANMPKSKRAAVVHLAKTDKKGKELSLKLFANVQEAADNFEHIFVFAVENMRNSYLKEVRAEFADSR